MDSKEFLDFGKAMIDFVANYTDNIRDRDVLADVQPGYLSKLIPEEAPQKPEDWQQVLIDVERFILPGVTHWNSPNFHAFYPAGNSYPAIVADILSAAIGNIGLSWIASPACTELEVITLNWMAKLLGLPKQFMHNNEGFGGGVIQGSASETVLIALLTAKEQTTRRVKHLYPDMDEAIVKTKLVAYSSDQSNSCVEKGGILASIPMRLLPTDEKCALRGETLLKAVKEDLEKGLIPCCVISTLGTTGTCAFDKLDELGPICKEYDMWLHVDAAYAGGAFICPEYRYLMSGIEYCDSIVVNAHKWLLVNFDCSLFWVKDSRKMIETFNVERIYLEHNKQGPLPDYRHWQISLGRRFRSLKIWFVLRIYGSEGIKQYIRYTIQMAQIFENYVKSDGRFELITERSMSLVCFRLRGDDRLTKELIDRLTERRKLYVTAATYHGRLIVRFMVGCRFTREEDITFAWKEITSQATEILQSAAAEREVHGSFKNSEVDIASRIKSLNIETKTQKIS